MDWPVYQVRKKPYSVLFIFRHGHVFEKGSKMKFDIGWRNLEQLNQMAQIHRDMWRLLADPI